MGDNAPRVGAAGLKGKRPREYMLFRILSDLVICGYLKNRLNTRCTEICFKFPFVPNSNVSEVIKQNNALHLKVQQKE